MRVLVLSGEITHTRPMSYGFPRQWETRVVELIDAEYLVLCEKYEGAKSVSLPETLSFLKRAYQRVLSEIHERDYDTIVGVGYGAHVLSNLVTAHEWRGPSVFIFSEGSVRMQFTSRPPLDEIEFDAQPVRSVWITVGDKAKTRTGRREKYEVDRGIAIHTHIFDHDWEKMLYSSGTLKSLLDAIF